MKRGREERGKGEGEARERTSKQWLQPSAAPTYKESNLTPSSLIGSYPISTDRVEAAGGTLTPLNSHPDGSWTPAQKRRGCERRKGKGVVTNGLHLPSKKKKNLPPSQL